MYDHIYSGSARLVSSEIQLSSKEISRAELKYMKIHPTPNLRSNAATGNFYRSFNVSESLDYCIVIIFGEYNYEDLRGSGT